MNAEPGEVFLFHPTGLDLVPLEDEEDDQREDDRGDGGIDDQRSLVTGDALRLGQTADQNRFRRDRGEAAGKGTDLADQSKHHGVITGGLAQGKRERGDDAEGRNTAGADGGDHNADEIDQNGSHDGVTAGELEELLAHQLQGPVGDADGTQEGDAQQHDEKTCAETADGFGVRLTDAGAEDGDSEDRNEADVDLAEEADQNDRHKDNQGNKCETVHGFFTS